MQQSSSCETDMFSVQKFPAFYGTRSSLLHSQEPATCPHFEPHQSSPSYLLKIHFNIIPPIYAWISQAVNFPQKINLNKIKLV